MTRFATTGAHLSLNYVRIIALHEKLLHLPCLKISLLNRYKDKDYENYVFTVFSINTLKHKRRQL